MYLKIVRIKIINKTHDEDTIKKGWPFLYTNWLKSDPKKDITVTITNGQ
jgi:hypothetical protein